MAAPTPPTVLSGARDTLNILQDGRMPDRRRDITDLDPNSVPLLRWTSKIKGKKEVTINPKFDWFEDQHMPYWSYADGSHNDSVTTVNVATGHGVYYQPGALVLVPSTGEIFRVRSRSTDALTVTRGAAGSTAGTIADAADLRIIGDAFAEGASGGTAQSTKKTLVYNYTQIFKTALGSTGTEEASQVYWARNSRTKIRKERGIDHTLKIESAFLWGERSEGADPDTGTPLRTTRGLINWISTNTTAINGYLNMDLLDTFISDGTRYCSNSGKNMKWLFVSRLVGTAINQFARDRLRAVPKDKTWGVKTQEYQTNHGRVLLLTHNLLENNPLSSATQSSVYGGYGVMVDPESPRMRFMAGRDNKLEEDIHDNDYDGWKDQYMGEVGLELHQEPWCSIMTGVSG